MTEREKMRAWLVEQFGIWAAAAVREYVSKTYESRQQAAEQTKAAKADAVAALDTMLNHVHK